jgi:tripartite-type tricarboxylate transporter receptor subunit TctC
MVRNLLRLVVHFSAAVGLGLIGMGAGAQGTDYPTRPIELVVPYGAGGGTDVLARAFAESAKKHLGQPVTVINKPGASGAIGMADVVQSRPDGYKLVMLVPEIAILPHIGIARFATEDLVPIIRLNADPLFLVVKGDSPLKSVDDFVETARKAKEPMRFGNAGVGGVTHLAQLALEQRMGTKFVHAAFQGNAPAILALLGGHIDAVTATPSEVRSYMATGQLKVLAVTSDQRLKGDEQIPTLKESKVDLTVYTWRGVGAPKGVAPSVMNKLVGAALRTAEEPAFKAAMEQLKLGYSVANNEIFRQEIARDSAQYKQLIDRFGLKTQ